MTERYDPKVSVRPLNERRPAQASPGDDPLVELARIVSGRSSFSAPPPQKGRSGPMPEAAPQADLARDLESELLNDLQATFAAIREPAVAPSSPPVAKEPPAMRPMPAPPTAAPPMAAPPLSAPMMAPQAKTPPPLPVRPQPDAPLQPGPAARKAEPPPPARVERTPPVVALPADPVVVRRPPERSERLPAEPPPSLPQPTPSAGAANRSPAPQRPQAPPQPKNEQPVVIRPVRPTTRPELAPPQPRPVATTGQSKLPAAPPVKTGPTRWDPPEEPRQPAGGRFAPPRSAPVRPAPPELPRADEDAFSDMFHFPEPPAEEELSLEDYESAEAYLPEEELPPFPEDELAEAGRRRPRRILALVGGVVAVLLVVVGGYSLYRGAGGTGGTPPIITADATPSKVTPEETAAPEADAQSNKLIYDRVDGKGAGEDTKLANPGEDPIAAGPPVDEGNTAISRVIIPGGPGIDRPPQPDAGATTAAEAAAGEAAGTTITTDEPAADQAATADDGAASIGPKKVRTVVVKPDGTIVSSEATAVDATSASEPLPDTATPDAATAAADTPAVPDTRTQMDDVLDGKALPVDTDPLKSAARGKTVADAAPAAAAGTVPAPGTAPAGDAESAASAPDTVAPPPAAKEPPPAKPVQVAKTTPVAPVKAVPPKPAPPKDTTVVAATGGAKGAIDVTPAAGAKPLGTATTPATGSGALVQVSSQKTEDAARSTFRDLQAKFPGILGTYKPNIVKADLGDRGVFYRVRVGPFAAADAQRLCDSLKSAGGDCIIAR